jgi:hypothetical protein
MRAWLYSLLPSTRRKQRERMKVIAWRLRVWSEYDPWARHFSDYDPQAEFHFGSGLSDSATARAKLKVERMKRSLRYQAERLEELSNG